MGEEEEATVTAPQKAQPIGEGRKALLWGVLRSHCGEATALPRPGADPALDAALAPLGLSRSQVSRQFDTFRKARSSSSNTEDEPHSHGGSKWAHKRRAFGAHGGLFNRLRSISSDVAFVGEVASRYPKLPLVANKRCGCWYAPEAEAECYFKSTDGHSGGWALNLRRLNLELLTLAATRGGAVIVDSTRRGRKYPDSFAKTLPIWCSCLNRGIFDDDGALYCAPNVAEEEVRSIEGVLGDLERTLRESLLLKEVLDAAAGLAKPLRCFWVTNDDLESFEYDENFTPLICVTASRPVDVEENDKFVYLQGAADDEECWAGKLTAASFWQSAAQILAAEGEKELLAAVAEIEAVEEAGYFDWLRLPRHQIAVGSRRAGRPPDCWENFDAIINVSLDEYEEHGTGGYYLRLEVAEGKRDKVGLEAGLPAALRFASKHLAAGRRLLVHCAQGRDRSVGVAVAILAALFNDEGAFTPLPTESSDEAPRGTSMMPSVDKARLPTESSLMLPCVDKARLLRCLQIITSSRHKAMPTRHTLKKIHRFFMSDSPRCNNNTLPTSSCSSEEEEEEEDSPPPPAAALEEEGGGR